MLTPIVVAWIEYFQEQYNAKAVKVNGKFKVVQMICENCFYKYSGETKHCATPNSTGCPTWKFKEAK